MLGDDISDDEILKEAIEFLVNNENSYEIELQFICDNISPQQEHFSTIAISILSQINCNSISSLFSLFTRNSKLL
jgi:hypothetical protein